MASNKRQRHINRIKRFIRTAEKRGYQFPQEIKENLSSYSTQKLKSITPQKLYEQATTEKFGVPMTGTRARQIERSMSAKKGTITRSKGNITKEAKQWIEENPDEFIKKLYESEGMTYIPRFTELVLHNVEQMITEGIQQNVKTGRETSANTAESASFLKEELQSEIQEFGRDKVALAMEQAPDEIIVLARETIWASSTSKCIRHCREMLDLIRGNIPTVEQAKDDEESTEIQQDTSDYEIL